MGRTDLRIQERVGIITYDNPPLNIIEMADLAVIEEKIMAVEEDEGVDVILFCMAQQGKVFCAGMALDEMLGAQAEEGGIAEYCAHSKRMFSSLERALKPTIYVYDGIVRGGGLEFSLYADMRFAGENVDLALPEISIGIIPGGGGTQTLARLVGESKAMELILSGRSVKAQEALDTGLVTQVFPSDTLQDEAFNFAKKLARHSSGALKAAKEAIKVSRKVSLYGGLKKESDIFVRHFATADAKEGIRAFKEKRRPAYENKMRGQQ